MRDLYKKLGVKPSASTREIESAINDCKNAALRRDASAVLLVERRRQSYDRLHSSLADIGKLRGRLGLNHAANWHGNAANDFTVASESPRSLHDDLIRKVEKATRQPLFQRFLNSIKELIAGIFRFAAGLAAVFGVLWFIGVLLDSQDSTTSPPATYQSAQPSRPAFNQPIMPLPASGTVRNYTDQERVAPFQINTSAGANYLVKLEEVGTSRDVADIFAIGGSTVEVRVPLGSYIVKYASGQNWYGYEYLFGPETSYNKADTTFRFRDDGYQISGYTITLYRVAHGNMQTRQISASDF
ncbi:MAG: hypothetical protein ACREVE_08730 [Gammaproteobacteria bacterium]